jgi:hypothetical protein
MSEEIKTEEKIKNAALRLIPGWIKLIVNTNIDSI